MIGTTEIEYQGNDLEITYRFTKGKGFVSRDIPPSEDDIQILGLKSLDGSELPNIDDIGTRWDLEMITMDKIR